MRVIIAIGLMVVAASLLLDIDWLRTSSDSKLEQVEHVAADMSATPPAAGNDLTAAVSDAGVVQIIAYNQIVQRVSVDLEIYRPPGSDLILILDFPSLNAQGRMLNRVAALIEKDGTPRDRILSLDELAAHFEAEGETAATYYFGHDYRVSDLAKFFNIVDTSDAVLNPEEEMLCKILLEHGLMTFDGEIYRASVPEQSLVTITQQQPDDLSTVQSEFLDTSMRASILRHELSHAEFFTNKLYRDYCIRFWHKHLPSELQTLFKRYLVGSKYDVGNQELIINEMQAYLAHTPDKRFFNAEALGVSSAELDALRSRFLTDAPISLRFEPMTKISHSEAARK